MAIGSSQLTAQLTCRGFSVVPLLWLIWPSSSAASHGISPRKSTENMDSSIESKDFTIENRDFTIENMDFIWFNSNNTIIFSMGCWLGGFYTICLDIFHRTFSVASASMPVLAFLESMKPPCRIPRLGTRYMFFLPVNTIVVINHIQ